MVDHNLKVKETKGKWLSIPNLKKKKKKNLSCTITGFPSTFTYRADVCSHLLMYVFEDKNPQLTHYIDNININ